MGLWVHIGPLPADAFISGRMEPLLLERNESPSNGETCLPIDRTCRAQPEINSKIRAEDLELIEVWIGDTFSSDLRVLQFGSVMTLGKGTTALTKIFHMDRALEGESSELKLVSITEKSDKK